MKRILTLGVALLLALAVGASAEQTALDAFHALMSTQEPTQAPSEDVWALLDAVMAGQPEGEDEAASAARLSALTAVTNRDIAAYASGRGLPVARVRNAWYRAMARTLAAEIALNPASEPRYQNAQAVLKLFLEPGNGDVEAERRQVRAQMDAEYGRSIAEPYQLPEDFVAFLVMNDHWDDDDWENDDDWQTAADGFEELLIGSRDGPGDSRIADMQALLIELGYMKGKADGVFGPRTQAALVEFQLANGLTGTGVYDDRSLERLQSADAVARWEYGDDFWKSEDYDTPDTPDTHNTPDTPNTPDKPDTPDTPDEPDTPDTPDTPDKPDTPDTPDSPDTPD